MRSEAQKRAEVKRRRKTTGISEETALEVYEIGEEEFAKINKELKKECRYNESVYQIAHSMHERYTYQMICLLDTVVPEIIIDDLYYRGQVTEDNLPPAQRTKFEILRKKMLRWLDVADFQRSLK